MGLMTQRPEEDTDEVVNARELGSLAGGGVQRLFFAFFSQNKCFFAETETGLCLAMSK